MTDELSKEFLDQIAALPDQTMAARLLAMMKTCSSLARCYDPELDDEARLLAEQRFGDDHDSWVELDRALGFTDDEDDVNSWNDEDGDDEPSA